MHGGEPACGHTDLGQRRAVGPEAWTQRKESGLGPREGTQFPGNQVAWILTLSDRGGLKQQHGWSHRESRQASCFAWKMRVISRN